MPTTQTANIVRKKRISNFKFNYNVWGYAGSLFLLSMPYFMWHSPFNIGLILLLLCFALSWSHIKVSSRTVFPIVSIIFLYIIISFRSGFNGIGITSILLICHLFLLDEKFLSDVFNAYILIFSFTIIPSLIVYILVMFIGVQLPNTKIEGINSLKEGIYLQYPFLVVYQEWGIVIPRFFGYYDEPGVVGIIAGVMLCVRKFNMKDKFNIPIFIAGLLSLSFSFFIVFAVYIIVFAKTKYKLAVIILVAFLVTYYYSNQTLYNYVFKRFEINEGRIVGDNRIADINFDSWYRTFQRSSYYYFGLGPASSIKHNLGGSSYKDVIIEQGLIFFILYLASFFILAFKKLKLSKELFIYILIFISIMYQRPWIAKMYYVFLFFASISALSRRHNLNIFNEYPKPRRL